MRVGLALVCVMLAAACQEQRQPVFMGAEVDALRAQHSALGQALQSKDIAAVRAFYDLSSLIYQPVFADGVPHVGVELSNQSLFDDPNGAIEFLHTEFEISGTLAVSRGECTLSRTNTDTDEIVQMRGYCMTSWRRGEDGIWRVAWESRNVARLYERGE